MNGLIVEAFMHNSIHASTLTYQPTLLAMLCDFAVVALHILGKASILNNIYLVFARSTVQIIVSKVDKFLSFSFFCMTLCICSRGLCSFLGTCAQVMLMYLISCHC